MRRHTLFTYGPVWLLFSLLAGWPASAATINVGTSSALTAALASVNPGDNIVLSNGNYSGFTVARGGTAAYPIMIRAANPGQAAITSGIISLSRVAYVTAQGLNVTTAGGSFSADGTSVAVEMGWNGATNCRLTRCIFDPPTNTLPANTFFTYLSGTCLSNRIDHCEFGWYTSAGCHAVRTSGAVTIAGVTPPADRTPWAFGYGPYNPNLARYTWIDHNYFHDHYTPAANGGETIQLGAIGDTGDYQDLYSLVEYNLFVNCNGDPEVISVKSSNNTLRYNTVRTSAAVFSLRAGNRDSVYGNFFMCGGSGGGIKLSEHDHKIYNNYIENSDPSSYPIMLESGNLYNSGFSHAEAFRVQLVHNTVVNPGRQVLFAHSGVLPTVDCTFANNIITGSGTLYSEDVTPVNPFRSQNIIYGYTPGLPGFLVENPQLTAADPEKLAATSPAIGAANTNDFPFVTEDMDGQPRSLPRDIGADKYDPASFSARAPLTTNDVGPNAVDIELSATPQSQGVNLGATNVSYTINVAADSGYTNLVTLTVTGLPPGMTARFNAPTVNGSGAATLNVTNTGAVPGGSYPLLVNATSSNFTSTLTVALQVGRGPANLRWASASSSAWNLQSSTNWFNPGSNAADLFYSGDAVLLEDTAGVQTNLTIAANAIMSPSVVTNNSNTNNFTLSGSGQIGGTARFVKLGASTLTLSTTNEFSGGITVAGGTLKAGNPYALGGQGGFVIITNSATLDLNGNNLGMDTILVSGAGASNNGAIINDGPAVYPALALVELAADTTFGGTGRWDLRSSGGTGGNPGTAGLSTSGNAFNLTKAGTNFFGLCSATVDPALGNLAVQAGTFNFEGNTTGLGDSSRTLTIFSNATFEMWSATNQLNKKITLNGGANFQNGNGANVIVGAVTLNGPCTFNVGGTSLTFSNALGGGGQLIKTGAAVLYLAGTNLYGGATVVGNGTVALIGGGSLSSSNLSVNAGATLDVTGRSDTSCTLNSGQTLAGGGTINGNVIVGNGATLAPGGSTGALFVNGNLTLNRGSTAALQLNKTAQTNQVVRAAGSLTYGGTLVLTNLSGTLASGDSFRLFSATSYSGSFTNILPLVPAVNLAWNTNGLTNGVLSIVAQPTPPPVFGTIGILGGKLVISGSHGLANWPYLLLASTNLALPLPDWLPVATNRFDPGGQFSVTNSTGAAGWFFRLLIQ